MTRLGKRSPTFLNGESFEFLVRRDDWRIRGLEQAEPVLGVRIHDNVFG